MNTEKKNFHLRNIPVEVYNKIEKNAEKHDRSVNGEILSILKKVKEV
jgi:hypothetical protein